MKYSRRTVIEALRPLANKSHSDIDDLAFTYDMKKYSTGDNRQERVRNLTEHLLDFRLTDEDTVNEIVEGLIEGMLKVLKNQEEYDPFGDHEPFEKIYPALSRALLKDGFVIRDFALVRQLPESIKMVNHEDELFLLLEKHNFQSRTNLVQAIDNHTRGEWESANGQLRTFMEALFNEMADKIHGADKSGQSSENKRASLAKTEPPLLDPELNELGNDGKNFSNGVMKRLHPRGPHPGLSNEEDCTFRVHLVVITASHYLRRFDSGVNSKM